MTSLATSVSGPDGAGGVGSSAVTTDIACRRDDSTHIVGAPSATFTANPRQTI